MVKCIIIFITLLFRLPQCLPSSFCPLTSTFLLRLIPENDDQVELIEQLIRLDSIHIKAWVPPSKPDFPVLLAARRETAQFVTKYCTDHGITVTTILEDVQTNLLRYPEPKLPKTKYIKNQNEFKFDQYHSWQEIDDFMEWLVVQSKGRCTWKSFGKTSEGKSMKIMTISPYETPRDKGVFIDAAIHAREWISASSAVFIANELCLKYDTDESLKLLVNAVTFYILPVFNVDGYEYSWTTDRYWRKSRSISKDCDPTSVYKQNITCFCRGVDLNRNFASAWNKTDSCAHPCCNTYAGTAPMSEPEVRTVADFLTKNQNRIQAYVSLHNYGQMFVYPYTRTDRRVVKKAHLMHEIAELAVKEMNKTSGRMYNFGMYPKLAYKFSGSSIDWVVNSTKIPLAFIIETRPAAGDFCVDESELIETGREIFAGIKVVGQAVAGTLNLTGKYRAEFRRMELDMYNGASFASYSRIDCINGVLLILVFLRLLV